MKNRHCFNTLSHSQRFANNYRMSFLMTLQRYEIFAVHANNLTICFKKHGIY